MRARSHLVVLAIAAAFPEAARPAATPQDLSAPESEVAAWIDEHNAEALALLRRAVDVNSGTMNLAGVREVGRLFAAPLEALGFETTWIDGAAWKRAGHLVARRPGRGPRILLIGHLDTVFEPESPFQRFELVGDTAARGPGVTDMKGGDVVLVQALRALAETGSLDGLSLTVILIGDEERIGGPRELARRALVEAADEADIAIAFEDGDGDPRTAVIARRGSSRWTLRTTGTPAHSSQVFREDVGAGAIFEAARILDGFRRALGDRQTLTFNPGLILGGTRVEHDSAQARGEAFGKNNVVAGTAVVSGDLRALSIAERESAKERMHRIVAGSLPGTEAEISFVDSYPPLAPTAGNERLLAMFDRASRDLGLGPVTAVNPRDAGAADVSFTAGRVAMAIDGIGLMGRGGHTVDETADLRTLPVQTKRAAVLLLRLSRGDSR
ncbi:MAG: M20/M25/M40 family metallo-hydrolase [Gemmatimonadota bacterium]